MKHILIFLFVFLTTSTAIANEKTYRVGIHKNFPPHYSLDENGNPDGFAIDYFRTIAQKMDIKYEFISFNSWKEINLAAKKKQIDIVPNFGIAEKRKELYLFSKPLETSNVYIYTLSKNSQFQSIEDLNGKSIATVETNVANRFLTKNYPQIYIPFKINGESLITGLITEEYDAIAFPETLIKTISRKFKLEGQIKPIYPPIVSVPRGVAVTHENHQLLFKIDSAINDLIATKEFHNIYYKWYGYPNPYWTSERVLKYSISIIIILIISLLTWRHKSLKSAYHLLKENKKLLTFVTNNISQVIYLYSIDQSKITYVSSGHTALFEDNFMETYKTLPSESDLIHPDDQKITQSIIQENFESSTWTVRYRITTASKNNKWIKEHGRRILDPDSGEHFIVGVISDITDYTQLEEKQKHQEQLAIEVARMAALGEMIDAIAHQWKQPINSMYLILQHLTTICSKNEDFDPKEAGEYIQTAEQVALHMSQTIDDFRSYFHQKKIFNEFDAASTVGSVYKLISNLLKSDGITFSIACECSTNSFSYIDEWKHNNDTFNYTIKGNESEL